MANNPNHMDNLTPFEESKRDRSVKAGEKGGIASGEARRLNKRLANLTKYTDRQTLTKHKRKLRKLWKVRNKGFIEGDKEITGEQVREEIADIIENMRIIKDCGGDVLNIVAIANSPYLAISKPGVVIKAQAELWDRQEGKATQNIVNSGSIETKTIYIKEKEDKDYDNHIDDTINGD